MRKPFVTPMLFRHWLATSAPAASSLSGYVTSTNRNALAFSILMNGSGLPLARAHAAQDAIAEILADSTP